MAMLDNIIDNFGTEIVCFSVIGILCSLKLLSSLVMDFADFFKTYLLPNISNHKNDFVKKYGKWAIVTGCTQGIGKSYVDELAKKGMNLVLISRDELKLEELARQIQLDYQGKDIQ